VNNVEIKLNTEVSNVKVSVESLNAKPSEVSAPEGEVFDYISIYLTNFGDEEVKEAVIEFEVEKSWVQDNAIDPDTIVLQRYDAGWVSLETSLESSDSGAYYYESVTPGFSYFAITGDSVEEEEAPEEEEIAEVFEEEVTGDVSAEAPEEGVENQERGTLASLAIVAGVIALLAAIIMLTYWLKKTKDNV
jgi:PGF-pre-PGF domain-containing protein